MLSLFLSRSRALTAKNLLSRSPSSSFSLPLLLRLSSIYLPLLPFSPPFSELASYMAWRGLSSSSFSSILLSLFPFFHFPMIESLSPLSLFAFHPLLSSFFFSFRERKWKRVCMSGRRRRKDRQEQHARQKERKKERESIPVYAQWFYYSPP